MENLNVIRKKDVTDLFDTTSDLSGNDIDISRWIRDTDNHDVQVFWRDLSAFKDADLIEVDKFRMPFPGREELCSVPIGDIREFLKKNSKQSETSHDEGNEPDEKTDKVKSKGLSSKLWTLKFRENCWKIAREDDVRAGAVFMADISFGCYKDSIGWIKGSSEPVKPVSLNYKLRADANSKDRSGITLTILDHSENVLKKLIEILDILGIKNDTTVSELIGDRLNISKEWKDYLGLDLPVRDILLTSALWHDLGKAHKVFQEACSNNYHETGKLLAKAPTFSRYNRTGFRHELASALAMLEVENMPFLPCYLVSAHHGKVRLSIRSMPDEKDKKTKDIEIPPEGKRFARGIYEGDSLPETPLGNKVTAKPVDSFSLKCMEIGLSDGLPSWTDSACHLRDALGFFLLAYIEGLLRSADERASARRG